MPLWTTQCKWRISECKYQSQFQIISEVSLRVKPTWAINKLQRFVGRLLPTEKNKTVKSSKVVAMRRKIMGIHTTWTTKRV